MSSISTNQKRFVTCDEFAEIFQVSRATVYRQVGKKEIPHVQIGSRILISQAYVDGLIRQASGGSVIQGVEA